MQKNRSLYILNLSEESDSGVAREFHKALSSSYIAKVINSLELFPVGEKILLLYAPKNVESLVSILHRKNQLYKEAACLLVLKEENYELLKSGLRMGVMDVLETPLQQSELVRTIGKVDLLDYQKTHDQGLGEIPINQLFELFSAPIRPTDESDLFEYLKDYMQGFGQVENFSLFTYKDELEIESGGGEFDFTTLEAEIVSLLPEEKEIGHYHVYSQQGKTYLLFPIPYFVECETWAVMSLHEDISKRIMNDYFISFLHSLEFMQLTRKKAIDYHQMANTDEVTGLFNQRKLSADLEEQIKLHADSLDTFSLMFIDVDHFKVVNDRWGHIVGSEMLGLMGDAIKKILRGGDFVYRYGGDEFVVIMPKVRSGEVYHIATRVLNSIKNMEFDVGDGQKHRLTVSIGIAEYPTDAKSAKEIIQFADEMMYLSKKSGRGRVFHVSEVDDADAGSK